MSFRTLQARDHETEIRSKCVCVGLGEEYGGLWGQRVEVCIRGTSQTKEASFFDFVCVLSNLNIRYIQIIYSSS